MNRSARLQPGPVSGFPLVLFAGLLLAGCASSNIDPVPDAPRTLDATQTRLLLAGDDRGLARVAELNGYPDPERVLQLGEALQLTADQRFKLTRLNSVAQGKARAMGQRIVDAERDLDLFLAGQRTSGNPPASDLVHARLDTIAGLHAMLRAIHVDARLEAYAVLDESQRERYADIANIPPPPEQPAGDAAESPMPLY